MEDKIKFLMFLEELCNKAKHDKYIDGLHDISLLNLGEWFLQANINSEIQSCVTKSRQRQLSTHRKRKLTSLDPLLL